MHIGRTFSSAGHKLSSGTKIITVVGIVIILALSFTVYLFLQTSYERQTRATIFDQYKQLQIDYAQSVSQNMASDLDSLMNRLQSLALSEPVQDGKYQSTAIDKLLQQTYNDANQVAAVDGIYILDSSNKEINSVNAAGKSGYGLPPLAVIDGYHKHLPNAYFSNAYKSESNSSLSLSLLYPIYNLKLGGYMGAVGMSIQLRPFLSQYGNLDDPNARYILVLDKNATVLTSPFKDNIGNQISAHDNTTGSSQVAVDHYQKVMSGQPDTQLYISKDHGEHLNTGFPVVVDDKPVYFSFVVTPTSAIYAQIDSLIQSQRIGFYLLQGGIAAAIFISLFFLVRWSGMLERAVRARTAQLEDANQQLKKHDLMQREFINIAAHELRTPVQPILGMTEMLGAYPPSTCDSAEELKVRREDLAIIGRNAARLERLSSDILDVVMIESGSMFLSKQSCSLGDLIGEAIGDAKRLANLEITIRFEEPAGAVCIVADRRRLYQVISNLLNNAIRFTPIHGIITVVHKSLEDSDQVTITDSGPGITATILPRLFTKFASTPMAGSGTGLGLYISKGIITAHGGEIWGYNNPGGKGATFGFRLPIVPRDLVPPPVQAEGANMNEHYIATS